MWAGVVRRAAARLVEANAPGCDCYKRWGASRLQLRSPTLDWGLDDAKHRCYWYSSSDAEPLAPSQALSTPRPRGARTRSRQQPLQGSIAVSAAVAHRNAQSRVAVQRRVARVGVLLMCASVGAKVCCVSGGLTVRARRVIL